MDILILLGSLTSAAILFFCSLYFSISRNKKWTKLMAFGLLNLAISCTLLLCFYSDKIYLDKASLIIATIIFIGLSALFYWAYQLIKDNTSTS